MEKTISYLHERPREIGTEMDWELTMSVGTTLSASVIACLSVYLFLTTYCPSLRPFESFLSHVPMFFFFLAPNCYVYLICYLDVDSVTGDDVGKVAYEGEVSL